MTYKEEFGDLFDLEKTHLLVHCISNDFALGAGIAKEFEKRYGLRDRLREYDMRVIRRWPDCIIIGGRHWATANLITKEKCYHKPTLSDLTTALYSLRDHTKRVGIKDIAMPKIGCGLDKLKWPDVSAAIKEVFRDTDVNITVRYNRR